VRASKSQRIRLAIYWINSAGSAISTLNGDHTILTANTWTRLKVTGTAPAGTVRFFLVPWSVTGTGSSVWAVNDTIDTDGFMFTDGTALYSYGDGDTNGWSWNGNVHNSTSTGPAVAQ
jgi:hypothetical protein